MTTSHKQRSVMGESNVIRTQEKCIPQCLSVDKGCAKPFFRRSYKGLCRDGEEVLNPTNQQRYKDHTARRCHCAPISRTITVRGRGRRKIEEKQKETRREKKARMFQKGMLHSGVALVENSMALIIKLEPTGCKDSSAIKSTCCSSGEPGLRWLRRPVPGDLTPSGL